MMRRLALCFLIAFALSAGSAAAASRLYIRGGGYGHGVGMSQYGAYGYALHGKGYRFILAHYYQGTSIGTTDPHQIVRVLLSTGSATFSGATRAGSTQLHASESYQVRALADGSLELVSRSGAPVGRFTAPLTVSGPRPLALAGKRYRGSFVFRPDGAAGVETVNAVPLDAYVRGVVAAEMPAGWLPAALEAQAVAARTFALTGGVGRSTFDLYADTRSQMYAGVSAETPATDSVVAATRGQVVTYGGAPVITYFFSSSGGHTESVQYAFPGSPPEEWLRGVPDPYDGAGGNPYHRWLRTIGTTSAASKLGPFVKGSFVGIIVTKHGVSTRIVAASAVGSGGSTVVSGAYLERALGLLSTDATFTTITTLAESSPAALMALRRAERLARGRLGGQLVATLAPLSRALLGATPAIHGNVFPGEKGDALAIQLKRKRGWRTVRRVRLASGGTVAAAVPGPGIYRFLYNGLEGPPVEVS